jgi:hypothetical protein
MSKAMPVLWNFIDVDTEACRVSGECFNACYLVSKQFARSEAAQYGQPSQTSEESTCFTFFFIKSWTPEEWQGARFFCNEF